MKKLFLLIATASAFGSMLSDATITKKERKFALKLLADTENSVPNSVKGLSDAQLKFKSAPDAGVWRNVSSILPFRNRRCGN